MIHVERISGMLGDFSGFNMLGLEGKALVRRLGKCLLVRSDRPLFLIGFRKATLISETEFWLIPHNDLTAGEPREMLKLTAEIREALGLVPVIPSFFGRVKAYVNLTDARAVRFAEFFGFEFQMQHGDWALYRMGDKWLR